MTFIYNFLFGFAIALYLLFSFLLVLIILVQKGKSSMGFGHLGGTSQLIFGGSGGQDLLQKVTWILGFLFIFGSLGLAIIKSRQVQQSRYLSSAPAPVIAVPKPALAEPLPVPDIPKQ